jgi:hypothetical protein
MKRIALLLFAVAMLVGLVIAWVKHLNAPIQNGARGRSAVPRRISKSRTSLHLS